MDWIQSVQSYIRVIEEGSFNAAARKLNTTSSAISKRILCVLPKPGLPTHTHPIVPRLSKIPFRRRKTHLI